MSSTGVSKEAAIKRIAQAIIQHKKTPNAIKLARLIDELAEATGTPKDKLRAQAQELAGRLESQEKNSSRSGGLGFTTGVAPIREVSVLDAPPLEGAVVVVADAKGALPPVRPGKAYVIAEVPADARVSVAPPSRIAAGAFRRTLSVTATYMLGEPRKAPEASIEETAPAKKK